MASQQVQASTIEPVPESTVAPGERLQLTYEQWIGVLEREARTTSEQRPKNLNILMGDSLSLWFPQELLPAGFTWLNQGISGETSYGLLHRVKLLDRTQPETIFVMIGINDLIRGVREDTLLANQREIIRHLKKAHPQARIVVQSILPHGGNRIVQQYLRVASDTTPPIWLNRLQAVPNVHIRELNQLLGKIASEEGVSFLDLYPFFVDQEGNLADHLSKDGLHLSLEGYRVWRSHLQASI